MQVVDTIPQIDAPRLVLAHEQIACSRYADAHKTLKLLAYSSHDSVDQQKAKALLAAIDEKEGMAVAPVIKPHG